jgi:hypothetical protein
MTTYKYIFAWMRWAGQAACMGEGVGVYRVLVGESEGKKPFGRPK